MKPETKRRIKKRISAWRRDPVLFVREEFRAEPDEWQSDVLRAAVENIRVAMMACKGPGKTCVLAWIICWFLVVYTHSKVIATSITGDNLRDGLWAELSFWQGRSQLLQELFDWSAERFAMKEHPETWFASARTWPKEADKNAQAASLAGVHAEYVLMVLDEVSEYPEGVVAAAEGNLGTGKVTKIVVAGNPTRPDGPLYRICTKDRAQWYVKEITGDPDDPKRAPRVSVEWARAVIAKYGRDSNYALTNVFAKFPRGGANNLIAHDLVIAAMKRELQKNAYHYAPKVLGVDVARFGDDRSVIQLRQGLVAFRPKDFRELDTMELTGQVVAAIRKNEVNMTFVDAVGVGAGVVDRLKELGYPVMAVEAGSKATNTQRYVNKRAEMWAEMAEWLKVGMLPDDNELAGELPGPIYKLNSAGQMVLEAKEDMKKRGLNSPDKADALALTFAAPVEIPSAAYAEHEPNSRNAVTKWDYDPYQGGA